MLLLTMLCFLWPLLRSPCFASSGHCFSMTWKIWWNLANPTKPRWEWLCLQYVGL
uniref:Uncharacterized protein n=1 Tax=Setaria italica TaxID=4555 RepID=K3ZPQ4_SETIT